MIYFYLSAPMAFPYAPNINSCFPFIHLAGIKMLISISLERCEETGHIFDSHCTERNQGAQKPGRKLLGRHAGAGAEAGSAQAGPQPRHRFTEITGTSSNRDVEFFFG